jgi:hypothetical protein
MLNEVKHLFLQTSFFDSSLSLRMTIFFQSPLPPSPRGKSSCFFLFVMLNEVKHLFLQTFFRFFAIAQNDNLLSIPLPPSPGEEQLLNFGLLTSNLFITQYSRLNTHDSRLIHHTTLPPSSQKP